MTTDAFKRLYEIIKTLRSENGCPWDKAQTPFSMRHHLMEETFEVIDAVTQGSTAHVKEELGDVFFNVLLLCHIYEQNGNFSLEDVLDEISDKIVRRHPHVFASEEKLEENDIASISRQWDSIKENVEGRKADCLMDSVPEYFPPLLKTLKLLKKASKKGFEWNCIDDASKKITEELAETVEASKENDFSHTEEEAGDLLMSVINYIRLLGIDPEIALDRADRKFCGRFSYVEGKMKENQLPMDSAHSADMIEFWKEAKSKEK